VPSSQALEDFLFTAPLPVLVPAVHGAPAVWIQNQKKTKGSSKALKFIPTSHVGPSVGVIVLPPAAWGVPQTP